MSDSDDRRAEPVGADDALLAELARVLDAHDPPPPPVVEAARAAWTWRTIDAELAELHFDSALETLEVRGLSWPRQLSFESRELTIEVEVDGEGLVGQVVPPAAVDILLVRPDGAQVAARSDAIGHFTFAGVARGTVRLQVTAPDGSVTTQWFTL